MTNLGNLQGDFQDIETEQSMQDSSLKEIFAFLVVLLVLILIATVIGNLGGKIGATKLVSGNIGPLFDYQTTEASLGENPQGIGIQLLDDIKEAGGALQTNSMSPSSTGIDEIIPVAYSGTEEHRFDTEKGEIKVDQYYFDEVLPLKITDEEIEDWWVTVKVKGGYTPYDGWIYVDQVKTDKSGKLKITWTFVESLDCCYDIWNATFTVKEPFCIDSNQYPDGSEWDYWNPGGTTIPGKDEFIFSWTTFWKGCPRPTQFFKLILV